MMAQFARPGDQFYDQLSAEQSDTKDEVKTIKSTKPLLLREEVAK